MKLKQEKRYVQKEIKDIEGAISVHQSVIDFDNPCDDELKHCQGAIEELMVDLEAYRHYLNCLNTKGLKILQNAKDLIDTHRIKVRDFKDLLEDLPDEAYIEFRHSEFDYPLEIETVSLNADVVEMGMI